MDALKHAEEKKRLNQALNGNLDKVAGELRTVFENNNIDLMPGLSYDICIYVIEELHLGKLNLPSRCAK